MVFAAKHRPTSVAHIFPGQWMNQTHLAGGTYMNSQSEGSVGASHWATMGKAYFTACATAIPIAVGAAVAAQRVAWLRPSRGSRPSLASRRPTLWAA